MTVSQITLEVSTTVYKASSAQYQTASFFMKGKVMVQSNLKSQCLCMSSCLSCAVAYIIQQILRSSSRGILWFALLSFFELHKFHYNIAKVA